MVLDQLTKANMKVSATKKLENILLEILDTSQSLTEVVLSESFDLELIRQLTNERGEQMLLFSHEFVSLRDKEDLPTDTLKSFTSIYNQILKKQRFLDDTINRKLSSLKREFAEMSKDKSRRSKYAVNRFQDSHNSSVLLTSKIIG
jgi:hypothetical protein